MVYYRIMATPHGVRLLLLPLVLACSATPDTADSQTPVAQDSILLVLRWGPLHRDSTRPGPTREIRWNWNREIVRIDTVSRLFDSLRVPAPTVGASDTVVVALWPLDDGPVSLRRMEILDARVLAQRHDGVIPDVVTLDERRRTAPQRPRTSKPPPPAPTAAAGGAAAGGRTPETPSGPAPLGTPSIELDFDDPENLGVTCAGSPLGGAECPNWFTRGWRKHKWEPSAGVDRSGAIVMNWRTGMGIGFSPIWIEAGPMRHFKLQYSVRQSAEMKHQGSAIKLLRLTSGGTRIGTLESKKGRFVWFWDKWLEGAAEGAVPLNVPVFSDNLWHTYEIELDYRNPSTLVVRFWFDGQPARTLTRAARRDLMKGSVVISPIAEMYSCGQSGCGNSINTGEYAVDDFSLTVLP